MVNIFIISLIHAFFIRLSSNVVKQVEVGVEVEGRYMSFRKKKAIQTQFLNR